MTFLVTMFMCFLAPLSLSHRAPYFLIFRSGTHVWKNTGGRVPLWKNQRWQSSTPVCFALLWPTVQHYITTFLLTDAVVSVLWKQKQEDSESVPLSHPLHPPHSARPQADRIPEEMPQALFVCRTLATCCGPPPLWQKREGPATGTMRGTWTEASDSRVYCGSFSSSARHAVQIWSSADMKGWNLFVHDVDVVITQVWPRFEILWYHLQQTNQKVMSFQFLFFLLLTLVCPFICPSVKRMDCDKTKAASKKSSIMTNRKSPMSFAMSLRWTYIAPNPQRGPQKRSLRPILKLRVCTRKAAQQPAGWHWSCEVWFKTIV